MSSSLASSFVYLDYNATAPLRSEAWEAMAEAREIFGNPSATHKAGQKARAFLEKARASLCEEFGVSPEQLIFTSGGTEANNLALYNARKNNGMVLASGIEHSSVLKAASNISLLPVTKEGRVCLESLEKCIYEYRQANPEASLRVAVMLANNETGVIQPIKEVAVLARRYNAFVHCDAVQALGKIPFKFSELGVASLAVSAHKIGGPKGVGALIINPDAPPVAPLLLGGGQERGYRAGTENIQGVAGFAAALQTSLKEDWSFTRKLRDGFERIIQQHFPEVPVYGQGVERLPNTSCLGMPGIGYEVQLVALDLKGFAISAGSACTSGKVSKSHVLTAMGVEDGPAGEAIRVSLAPTTLEAEMTEFAQAWLSIYEQKRVGETEIRVA